MSSGTDYTRINAIGATTLSVLTVVSAAYLLYRLLQQGRGKLRVRLLIGLVSSDIFLGIIVLPTEIAYLAGNPFKTDTPACDTFGFLLTAALFTQHMWTLAIAIATFLLLKYPLSRSTAIMERYSWTAFPGILAISAIHSGLWLKFYGFDSAGNICYYGGSPDGVIPDARDLIQFIPRAITFITVAILYSMLYRFLRRPDTIQVSSHMPSRRGSRVDRAPGTFSGGGALHRLGTKMMKQGKAAEVDERPPWEQMEFVQVGHRPWEDEAGPVTSLHSLPSAPDNTALPSRSESLIVMSNIRRSSSGSVRETIPSLERRSSASSRDGSGRDWEQQRGSDAETLVTPQLHLARAQIPHALSPVLSEGKPHFESQVGFAEDEGDYQDGKREKEDQTMAEFFQEYQVSSGAGQAELGSASNGGAPQMSAAAYFNRQASLLMLYFPLAYVVIFSASLVRLIYDMTTNGAPNPILSIVSAWFTLSVGAIDALVYGLAEFMVKRKVRRKMPDRI